MVNILPANHQYVDKDLVCLIQAHGVGDLFNIAHFAKQLAVAKNNLL